MKPKYNLIKNTIYAINGFKEILKEKSFQLELYIVIIGFFILLFIAIPLWAKIFMFASLFVPLIIETINSAIEATVDLVTDEFHILAKKAKDIASFSVMISFLIPILVWVGFILLFN